MLISRPILADLAVRLHALPSGLRAATVDVGDLDPLDVVRAGAAAFGFAAFFSSVDGRSVGALGVSGGGGPGARPPSPASMTAFDGCPHPMRSRPSDSRSPTTGRRAPNGRGFRL